MKGFVKLAIVVVVAVVAGNHLSEWKASSMVNVAAAMGRDGRHQEALEQLDSVQSWFSWTDAAERVEEERDAIRQAMQSRDQQRQWDRELDEEERRRKEEEAEQRAHERAMELAKERDDDHRSIN